jgi:hypothetical protein
MSSPHHDLRGQLPLELGVAGKAPGAGGLGNQLGGGQGAAALELQQAGAWA